MPILCQIVSKIVATLLWFIAGWIFINLVDKTWNAVWDTILRRRTKKRKLTLRSRAKSKAL